MSGSRCKELRREFVAVYGRSPRRTHTLTNEQSDTGIVDPLDPKRKGLGYWLRRMRIRRLFSFTVDVPSEWRQVKKAYLAGRREA